MGSFGGGMRSRAVFLSKEDEALTLRLRNVFLPRRLLELPDRFWSELIGDWAFGEAVLCAKDSVGEDLCVFCAGGWAWDMHLNTFFAASLVGIGPKPLANHIRLRLYLDSTFSSSSYKYKNKRQSIYFRCQLKLLQLHWLSFLFF